MRIVALNINKVFAEKTGPMKGQIEIKSGLDVKQISEEKVGPAKEDHLKFEFAFTIEFRENIGKIEILCSALVKDDDNQTKEILKEWKKKQFNHPIKLPLFNLIMDKCNLKALELEDQVNLPFHIPFPKVAPQKKAEE